jgi:hypothetical protein
VFSLIGYIIIWGGAALVNLFGTAMANEAYTQIEARMLRAMLDENVQPDYLEILLAIVAASLVGICAAWATNRKLAFRLFHSIKVTNHFGDDDVWSFIMNSDDYDWVIVRDHKLDLAYVARIEQFSDSGEKRELVLGSVDVRNNKTWRLLYKAERSYLSRDDQDLSVEILSLKG